MRIVTFAILLVLGAASPLSAHLQGPITEYVQISPMVCIVKATGVEKDTVTFSVEEVIKGAPPTVLTLTQIEVPTRITKNSEWLIARTGSKDAPGYLPINTVGWALKGDHGWVNAPIQRIGGKIHLVGKYGSVDADLARNPGKGLGLDELRKLATTPLERH